MKKLIKKCLVLAGVITIAASCQYKFIVEPVVPPPDPEDTISFSLQIEPVFTNTDCISCHTTGQTKHDLTSGNAYNSISSMSLTDTDDPESSIIYVKPHPSGSHYKKYSSSDAALVLQWIEQGAKNN